MLVFIIMLEPTRIRITALLEKLHIRKAMHVNFLFTKIVSEYNQEIPQPQTADNPVAPRGRAAQPSRDTRRTN